jgi:sodium-independent sulfate anion transporter 11
MQYAGNYLRNDSNLLGLSLYRNAIVLIIFTGISYGVSRNLKTPRFAIAQVSGIKIESPAVLSSALIEKVAGACITVFRAVSSEHLAIAKGFSRSMDES